MLLSFDWKTLCNSPDKRICVWKSWIADGSQFARFASSFVTTHSSTDPCFQRRVTRLLYLEPSGLSDISSWFSTTGEFSPCHALTATPLNQLRLGLWLVSASGYTDDACRCPSLILPSDYCSIISTDFQRGPCVFFRDVWISYFPSRTKEAIRGSHQTRELSSESGILFSFQASLALAILSRAWAQLIIGGPWSHPYLHGYHGIYIIVSASSPLDLSFPHRP